MCAARGRFEFLALTDTNAVCGAVAFQQACDAAGLRPIHGAQLMTRDHTAVVLAETEAGWGALCRAITAIHWDAETSLPELLANDHQGLAILSSNVDFLERFVALTSSHSVYAELRPGRSRHQTLATARRLGVLPVISGGVICAQPSDWEKHRFIRAIHDNAALSAVQGLRPRNAWLRSADELMCHFPDVPEALANTMAVAERCRFRIRTDRSIPPRLYSHDEALIRLRALAEAGVRRRYRDAPDSLRRDAAERLRHELEIIGPRNFADYFLIVHEISEEFPIHCGRGSVANSLVAYALGITNVDPLAANLLFERFLNPSRRDPPDIDLDFPWDERDRVLAWIFQRYPRPQAAMVANHNTLQVAGALREVAKVMGRPAGEIRAITRRVPWYARGPIARLMQTHPNFRGCNPPAVWKEIARIADLLVGTPRHLSLHPGGVVIVPGALTDHVPLVPASKQLSSDPERSIPVIQFEKDATEDVGLIKIDILGNRSLAVIRDARNLVTEQTGQRIDIDSKEAGEDPATQSLFCSGRTIGVFYTESPASRIVNTQSRARDFETLVLNTSIIRPAANRWIKTYLERRHYQISHGCHGYTPLDPSVDQILARSYGIMVYQEDVVNVAHAYAGFSWAEADGLRKALSRKRPGPALASWHERFLQGAREAERPDEVTGQLWEMILSFAGYSFCKGHSCSYIQVAQQSAWLKANHPAEFFAAVLSNEGGFYRPFAYVGEAQRDGLRVLLPDVNRSHWRWRGRGRYLLTGFQMIKGLSRITVERMITARTASPFTSLADLRARASLGDDDCRLLVKVGAVDSIAGGCNRPQLLWEIDAVRPRRTDTLALSPVSPIPALRDYDQARKRGDTWDLLGFCVDQHPMSLYARQLAGFRLTLQRELSHQVGNQVLMAGLYLTGKPVSTATDELMQFATFDDGTGLVECVLFPEVYRRFSHLLFDPGPYLFRGRVSQEFGVQTVIVSALDRLERVLARRAARAIRTNNPAFDSPA